MNYTINSLDDLNKLIKTYGFLPFFANKVKGFSIEEHCPPELWFSPYADGPWEWKGPAIRTDECIYGKFFNGKAGFVSREWIPDFVNLRRDGYDFDARCDDGLVYFKDKELFEAIDKNLPILSKDLKSICNYGKNGKKGFETVITRLQMQTYICIADFVYMRDKNGSPYGWGVAEYTTPEAVFGYGFITSAYKRTPLESKQRILSHLKSVFPDEDAVQLNKMI